MKYERVPRSDAIPTTFPFIIITFIPDVNECSFIDSHVYFIEPRTEGVDAIVGANNIQLYVLILTEYLSYSSTNYHTRIGLSACHLNI
jgi:hypothetical protein